MNALHDIVTPSANWLMNLLQPGYWLVGIIALCTFFGIRYWYKTTSWRRVRKNMLRVVRNTPDLNPAQLNAVLFSFFRDTKTIPSDFDISNRDAWRRLLISHNEHIAPSYALYMTYYYRQEHAEQLGKLQQQTIVYLQGVSK